MFVSLAKVDGAHDVGNADIYQEMYVEGFSFFVMNFMLKDFYLFDDSRLKTLFTETKLSECVQCKRSVFLP